MKRRKNLITKKLLWTLRFPGNFRWKITFLCYVKLNELTFMFRKIISRHSRWFRIKVFIQFLLRSTCSTLFSFVFQLSALEFRHEAIRPDHIARIFFWASLSSSPRFYAFMMMIMEIFFLMVGVKTAETSRSEPFAEKHPQNITGI